LRTAVGGSLKPLMMEDLGTIIIKVLVERTGSVTCTTGWNATASAHSPNRASV
jgi:hypothetical protein